MSRLARLRDGIGARLRALSPAMRRATRENARLRGEGLATLAAFATMDPIPTARLALVDGQWDNANYWIRLAIVMRALGIDATKATGLLGRWKRDTVDAAFTAFGIAGRVDHGAHFQRREAHLPAARALLANVRTPDDMLALRLPKDLPPALVYDGILKRQRRACIDLEDGELPMILAEALASIEAAEAIFDENAFDLLVLSHSLDFTYGAIAWAALRRGISTLVLYGDFGVPRFIRMKGPCDLFSSPLRPMRADDDALTPEQATRLEAAGESYLAARLGGRADDVGSIYAYRKRTGRIARAALCERFGWDRAKPIVAVYAPNWFDYPHSSDHMPYRDFLEWAEQTIAIAGRTTAVNWLFKSHPCDEWYGTIRGARLADLLAVAPVPNCALADLTWNGADLFGAIDALTTFHGTAGIEAASLGKPVLVPYSGWYGDSGFAHVAKSRDDYIRLLATPWWTAHDAEMARRRANRFAGWYFCVPAWHGDYAFYDDANQDAIWWDLRDFLADNATQIAAEIALIREWMGSDARYLHIHKLRRAADYRAPRAREVVAGDPRQRQMHGTAGGRGA